MRVALVHDWLTGMRGGEHVLAELCGMFPDATVYTLVHAPGAVPPIESAHAIVPSLLDRLPFGRSHYRLYLPAFPALARTLAIDPTVDLVISSSHAAAMSVRAPDGAVHVCYCHSPMRYIWGDADDYFAFGPFRTVRSAALRAVRPYLRRWDLRSSERVDRFLANSEFVAERIRHIYGRDATVVYPPVDTDFYTPAAGERSAEALVVSALVPHKRVDLAVRAYSERGWPLAIVGEGIERRALERIAGPTCRFLGRISRERLRELYRTADLLVVPGREDFGIAIVEAQACGLPVVALAEGGACETVVQDATGQLFHERSTDAVTAAVVRARSASYAPAVIRSNAERFAAHRFRAHVRDVVAEAMAARRRRPTTR